MAPILRNEYEILTREMQGGKGEGRRLKAEGLNTWDAGGRTMPPGVRY